MEIICRFDNQDDLDKFNQWAGLSLNHLDLEYCFSTGEKKSRKTEPKITVSQMYIDKMKYWLDLPFYSARKVVAYATIKFKFDGNVSLDDLSKLFQQKISPKTKSVWFPKLIAGSYSTLRFLGGQYQPNIPIYVVSKGRADKCSTSRFLSQMEVPHFVIVEPDEIPEYLSKVENEYAVVIPLDMSYKDKYDTFDDLGNTKSKGPGAARNYAWDHSISLGAKWHWVMDDNATEGFHYLFNNQKIKLRTGAFFNAIEDFVQRFDNVPLAGLNYSKFCIMDDQNPPFILNTRIYSFCLIKNDIPYRWRGRYNEDTDLSLRILKDGYCTIQINTFLAGKATTQTVQGGNTEEFYKHEGTLPKSEMLKQMHPDMVEVVWKFNRWHHQVNYKVFQQPLIYKQGYIPQGGVSMYGMYLIDTQEKETTDSRSYLESKYKDAPVLYDKKE